MRHRFFLCCITLSHSHPIIITAILRNALLRSNPLLLEKGLRAMIKIPKCRLFLDFDVKRLVIVAPTCFISSFWNSRFSDIHYTTSETRAWFKSQLRRVKQQGKYILLAVRRMPYSVLLSHLSTQRAAVMVV